jgi:hypothetical protein
MKFKDLQAVFEANLVIEDKLVVRAVVASVIANQLDGSPVWLMVVAPSSGGKTEILMSLTTIIKDTVSMTQVVSDISPNSFISGMKSYEGDHSLLLKMPKEGGMLLFKDFTSILSKRKEDRAIIMSQLREIYDGSYTRVMGNGSKTWEGRVGVIGGCTPAIYSAMQEFSVMGERLMLYQMLQPDRKEALRFVINKEKTGENGDAAQKAAMKEYIEAIFAAIEGKEMSHFALAKETEEELIDVADFCTIARSGVEWNDRANHGAGAIARLPSKEMPFRAVKQLMRIAKALVVMNLHEGKKDVLGEQDRQILYKIAFDSIPDMRRKAMQVIAGYTGGATAAAIAMDMALPTDSTRRWLEELNALGIIERSSSTTTKANMEVWKMKPEYATVVCKFENIVPVEGEKVVEGDEAGAEQSDAFGFQEGIDF